MRYLWIFIFWFLIFVILVYYEMMNDEGDINILLPEISNVSRQAVTFPRGSNQNKIYFTIDLNASFL